MKNNSRPSFILLIGSGRVAHHLQFYFQQKNILFSTWDRSKDLESLQSLVQSSNHILLAISDSSLTDFIAKNLTQKSLIPTKKIVHFSGALNIEGAFSAHPLMSFGPDLYSLEDYEKIHFSITGADKLSDLIPGLMNPFTKISEDNKALYHALCVMGGNFPILLWQKMKTGLSELGLPDEAIKIYMEKILENFHRHGRDAMTGPLVRKDIVTIQSNLKALSGDSFQSVYSAFVEAYK